MNIKPRFALFSVLFVTVILFLVLLITGGLSINFKIALAESTAQLPISCEISSINESRDVDPETGCNEVADVIQCPASAPNIYMKTENLPVRGNIRTFKCIPNGASELTNSYKCKKPNGTIYYSDFLCAAYGTYTREPDGTAKYNIDPVIYDEIIQCEKNYRLENGGCNEISSSSPTTPMMVLHTWTFSDGQTSGYIMNKTDQESKDFIASIEAQCSKIPKSQFKWRSSSDPITIKYGGIPDCSGSSATPSPTPSPTPKAPLACPAEKALCKKGTKERCAKTCSAKEEMTCPTDFAETESVLGVSFKTCKGKEKTLEGLDLRKPEAIVIRENIVTEKVVEKIVEKEIPSILPETKPPEVITQDTCKTYQKNVLDTVIQQGFALVNTVEQKTKERKGLEKSMSEDIRKNTDTAIKRLRQIQEKTKKLECNEQAIATLEKEIDSVNSENFTQVREDIGLLKKNEQERTNWFGVREDFQIIESIISKLKGKQDIKAEITEHEELQKRFDELFYSEGLVLEREIVDLAEATAALRKKLEGKQSIASPKTSSIKKKKEEEMKPAAKKTVKSSKKKTTKKTTKKTKKKTAKPTTE